MFVGGRAEDGQSTLGRAPATAHIAHAHATSWRGTLAGAGQFVTVAVRDTA